MASLLQPAPVIGGLICGGMALASMGGGGDSRWLPVLLVPVVLPMGVFIGCCLSIACTMWFNRLLLILLILAMLISARSSFQLLSGIALLLTTIPPPTSSAVTRGTPLKD